MNHELAKELKDAGFPQLTKHGWDVCPHGKEGFADSNFHCDEGVAAPTLEELMEACKASGGYFRFKLDWSREPVIEGKEWSCTLISKADCPVGTGSTPTEAVARLWLALNPTK